jgi:hypothetical protein
MSTWTKYEEQRYFHQLNQRERDAKRHSRIILWLSFAGAALFLVGVFQLML